MPCTRRPRVEGPVTGGRFGIPFATSAVPLVPAGYPTHADYVDAVARAAAQDVVQGFLLPVDAAGIRKDAVH